MPICPHCAAEYVGDLKVCPADGTPLTRPTDPQDRTPRKCPKCGAPYQGQKFCARDGTPLVDAVQERRVDPIVTVLVWALPLLPWIALYFVVRHGPFRNRFWKGETIIGFGLTVGGIAFLIGFVGPMLVGGGNQGPLLGIFYTGPIGTVVGLIWGLIRAGQRHRRR